MNRALRVHNSEKTPPAPPPPPGSGPGSYGNLSFCEVPDAYFYCAGNNASNVGIDLGCWDALNMFFSNGMNGGYA